MTIMLTRTSIYQVRTLVLVTVIDVECHTGGRQRSEELLDDVSSRVALRFLHSEKEDEEKSEKRDVW